MRKIHFFIVVLLVAMVASCASCGDKDGDSNTSDTAVALEITSCSPAAGATDVKPGTEVFVEFDGVILIDVIKGKVTVNGDAVQFQKNGKRLVISGFAIEQGNSYSVVVSSGTIQNYSKEIVWTFTAEAKAPTPDPPTPDPPSGGDISANCINSGNANTQRLYKFLYDNYGKKIISGSMANVSVEQKEAALVKAATGKTPLMQTFDFTFVTLTADRSTWEQNSVYQDISYYKDLYEKGGVVSACWHLNVPTQEAYAAKDEVNDKAKAWGAQVYFSAKNAVTSGTWENDFLNFSFDCAVEVLLKYKESGIPIVWRPFHEGSGNATITGKDSDAWFWWGKDGAEAYKKLWVYMFDYFKAKGLDNLIWVWTSQIGVGSDGSENWFCSDDTDWYPGAQYVDIIARDNYNKSKVSSSVAEYESLHQIWPDKIIALGENGNIANISEIFAAGGKYSYFMPWYTHNLASLDNSDHAKTAWWLDAAKCGDVLFLEDL